MVTRVEKRVEASNERWLRHSHTVASIPSTLTCKYVVASSIRESQISHETQDLTNGWTIILFPAHMGINKHKTVQNHRRVLNPSNKVSAECTSTSSGGNFDNIGHDKGRRVGKTYGHSYATQMYSQCDQRPSDFIRQATGQVWEIRQNHY